MSDSLRLKQLDDEIASCDSQIKDANTARQSLIEQKHHLLQLNIIPHEAAVAKLREIYNDAVRSESSRSFIMGIIDDPLLKQWFENQR